ncbi:MAG: hypothetical protein A2X25_10665 [Chloroflexi bacterium GWB2_49_20]|nr:MAG: hypothetical protein A2X25_10665 [Chloroflexi bacterium GWB2_49_20]OGN78979.1 MAG: hypothetical protein A2X26_00690 [Chloroflexi bacterium GWC2_49_37]OGN86260.1 MAG: hypothetical protein A2X27_05090 [Chloroflexi bacterium GWD2_49_16]
MAALYHLDIQTAENGPQTTWIYALVVPFPTIIDDVLWDDFLDAWQGRSAGPFAGAPLWMDSSTLKAISALLGPPASDSVRTAPADILTESAWLKQPSWGIVPFDELKPRWKVLNLDGQSPISKDFDPDIYPLKVTFGFQEEGLPPNFTLPESNRDPGKLTTLIMTGVTAMVRATAAKMERNGILYPGKDIRAWLLSADLTHISNEIPFSENCPFPDPNQATLVFCSDPKYITLLEDVGTDIVELTGNHFQDWGSDATLLTLEMYDQRGWIYFGGGVNLADARSAKTIIHNGNKLAFIGCNPAGPQFAWATDYQPGAAPCDFGWMESEINRLRSEGYLPIVTFQYAESYSIHPLPDQVDDFRAMAAAGAVIVSGSQAHLPQTIEFYNESFIHYGLGNLFFDQMDFPVVGTRREFIDRHIFYDGKYIGTELLTAMLEDYSRPRPMTLEERFTFLEEIFSASGWY